MINFSIIEKGAISLADIKPNRAERLKTLLNREGISQKELGSRIGVSEVTISKIMTGRQPLTDQRISDIISSFPVYRRAWLAGEDEYMTEEERRYSLSRSEEEKAERLRNAFLSVVSTTQFQLLKDSDKYVMYLEGKRIGECEEASINRVIEEMAEFIEFRLTKIKKGFDQDRGF